MSGGGGGGERKLYRTRLQKQGISLPNQPAQAVPQKANPVKNYEPNLGGTRVSHPFLKSKKPI